MLTLNLGYILKLTTGIFCVGVFGAVSTIKLPLINLEIHAHFLGQFSFHMTHYY